MTALWRRAAAEFVGTAALVTTVVGSGIMAQTLSTDGAVRLLANSTATVFGLAVLIAVFGPISGAHFNPVVSLADWWLGRRTRTGLAIPDVGGYVAAQTGGAIAGAIIANLMFDLPAIAWSQTIRSGAHLWFAEIVATTGLVVVIVGLVRTGKAAIIPAAVGAYIGAAYWFTSSTSFANPAVTIGRAFTDTYAGIAPGSVAGFVAAQAIGMVAALGLIAVCYPVGPAETAVMTNAAPEERQAQHA
ncbi:transport protein [Rhizocola hellebori]|uniref:Transport protein n=2 Tax=Rhizocola hellebori TaxID=1392758 RepID=A0A8J3VDK8_9ACTN|nr:transport protein [Rhizocola hellebori]